MELHGSVQATLQALALRLARMQEVNLVEISQVLEQVRKALSRIENQEYLAGQQFESLLTELKELWEGTASIDWEISAEAELALEKGASDSSQNRREDGKMKALGNAMLVDLSHEGAITKHNKPEIAP